MTKTDLDNVTCLPQGMSQTCNSFLDFPLISHLDCLALKVKSPVISSTENVHLGKGDKTKEKDRKGRHEVGGRGRETYRG